MWIQIESENDMINLIDLHTHTVESGHAYSTLQENIQEAKKKGLKILGYSEHGPEMPGGPHIFHIANLKVLPRKIEDLILLRGCEANIMDFKGNIDIPERISEKLDYMIASLHDVCIKSGSISENTDALIRAMDNPDVMIIGHAGNPAFPIDIEKVVKNAGEKDVLIEINNSSFKGSRFGSKENCSKIAEACMEHGTRIIIGSDSHMSYQIGGCNDAMEMLEEIGFDNELILNDKPEELLRFLKGKGKIKDIDL